MPSGDCDERVESIEDARAWGSDLRVCQVVDEDLAKGGGGIEESALEVVGREYRAGEGRRGFRE